MKLIWLFINVVLIGLISAACAPAPAAPAPTSGASQPPTSVPVPTISVPTVPAPTAGPKPGPTTGQDVPEAGSKAIEALAQQAGVGKDQIKVISVEEVEWPDSCLGVHKPGVFCTQVITPGYRVILEAGGKTYTYRTNRTGSAVVLAQDVLQPPAAKPALSWELQGETCQTAAISTSGLLYGPCKGAQKSAPFADPTRRTAELKILVEKYQSFTADTKAGKVTFNGQGSQKPTPAEERSLAEWARLVWMEASGKQVGSTYDLALNWHREGGIAGFCDDLKLYLTGFAYASSCKNNSGQDAKIGRLTTAQLDQLYTWVDGFKSFALDHTDPASADAMTVKVAFTGADTKAASPEEQQAIQTFAADLFVQIQQQVQ